MHATIDEGILTFISTGGPIINEIDWEEFPRGYRCALCGNDVLFARDEKDQVTVTHLKEKRDSSCELHVIYEGTRYVYVIRNIKPWSHADIAVPI